MRIPDCVAAMQVDKHGRQLIHNGCSTHDPEMSCTGCPSRTNLSCAIVKFPAAARPARQHRAARAAAKPTGILHENHVAHRLLGCSNTRHLAATLAFGITYAAPPVSGNHTIQPIQASRLSSTKGTRV